MENNNKNIKEKILGAIESGHVKMRPKWHFAFKAILLLLGIFIALLLLLFLTSFIFFSLRQTGALFAPGFGPPGWFSFLRALPWLLIVFSLAFLFLLEFLVRKYSFAYREPLIYSVVGIIIVAALGSLILLRTPLHQRLLESSRGHMERFNLVGPLYRGYGMRDFDDIHRGVVKEITASGFILEYFRGTTSTAEVIAENISSLQVGDRVLVFGDEENGIIRAFGIREDIPPPPSR